MNFDELTSRFAKIEKYFEKKYPHLQGDLKVLAHLGKITEELGELNSAVYGELGLHRKDKQDRHEREMVEKEWADVFNTVILFGMAMNIDMPKTIEKRLEEIFERLGIEEE